MVNNQLSLLPLLCHVMCSCLYLFLCGCTVVLRFPLMAFFAFRERDTCLCPSLIYVRVARAHVKCSAVSMPVISGRRVERVEWLGTV